MKLFLPNARAINWLLIVGFCSIGYALYMRYLAVEQSTIGLASSGGTEHLAVFHTPGHHRFVHLFGFRMGRADCRYSQSLRPSLVLFALALAAASCGVVLYNVGLSSFAAGLLVLSLARRAPEPD